MWRDEPNKEDKQVGWGTYQCVLMVRFVPSFQPLGWLRSEPHGVEGGSTRKTRGRRMVHVGPEMTQSKLNHIWHHSLTKARHARVRD